MGKQEATPPNTCALLVALPMDLISVQKALLGGSYNDFITRGRLQAMTPNLFGKRPSPRLRRRRID